MSEQEQHSRLIELNPQLTRANGIYQDNHTQIRDSRLSSYIQGAVNDSLDHAEDHSLYSIDIEKLLLTDELRSAFSPASVNFLLAFNFTEIGNTLDLTQGFGGTTHFLADKVAAVDCVRIDSGHARLSAKRCSEFNNVSYVSEDISKLNIPVNHYDLIIISQLESLELTKAEQATLLDKLRDSLSDTGCLVVGANNRNRLSKWLSTGSDIIDYRELYQHEGDTSYTEQELDDVLLDAGFSYVDAYASYSSPGAISNLFSKQYINTRPHSLNHFNRLGGIDNSHLNEYLLFRNLAEEQLDIFNIASRFVMIAGASSQATQRLCNTEFAHFAGTGRKPQWRATTQHKNNSSVVTKTLLHQHIGHEPEKAKPTIVLNQITEPQTFQSGTLLLDKWLSALLENDPVCALKEHVTEYADWLREIEKEDDFCQRAYDVLPFNIIVDEHDQFRTIDPEWVVDAQFSSDFILFRALFWFAFENKALLKALAKQSGAFTIGLFVIQFMDNIDSLIELSDFVEMEEVIQRQIGQNFRNKSVEYALLQSFDGEEIPQRLQPACQISWSDEAGIVEEHNSVFLLWKSSTNEQKLSADAPKVQLNKDILRIDPIASLGLFSFSSLTLRASDGSPIWQLDSGAAIAQASQGLNVSAVESEDGVTRFIALNEDPHFLFAMKSVPNWQHTETIEVTFALTHNQYYNDALATLSHTVSEQNAALGQQIGVLDTKQAEIDYLSSKLNNVDKHRQALQAAQHQAQLAHQEHTNSLTNTLNEQIERNRQLENHPLIKMILRINRLISKVLSKT